MASSEINLDGSEISIIKAIGLSGGDVDGKTLLDRLPENERRELHLRAAIDLETTAREELSAGALLRDVFKRHNVL